MVDHPWKRGIAVGRLRVTVQSWAIASVELVHVELIVQRIDFLTNGSVADAFNDPIFVALNSFHCCWFPRHTFPGSSLDPSRHTNSEFESPVVVVANAEKHLKFLQVGNLVLEMPHQALPIFRPVIIKRGRGLPPRSAPALLAGDSRGCGKSQSAGRPSAAQALSTCAPVRCMTGCLAANAAGCPSRACRHTSRAFKLAPLLAPRRLGHLLCGDFRCCAD